MTCKVVRSTSAWSQVIMLAAVITVIATTIEATIIVVIMIKRIIRSTVLLPIV